MFKHHLMIFLMTALLCTDLFASHVHCRDQILKTTCLVASEYIYQEDLDYYQNQREFQNQKCLSGSKELAQTIYNQYQGLPEHTKKAFCYIKKIYVVDGSTSFSGLAHRSHDFNKPLLSQSGSKKSYGYSKNGYILSLSKKEYFNEPRTMIEEKNAQFKRAFKQEGSYSDIALPEYQLASGNNYSALQSTIIHEVGHFLEFSRELIEKEKWDKENLTYVSDSDWFKLSWGYTDQYTIYGNLVFQPQIETPLSQKNYGFQAVKADDMADLLGASPFASLYALTNPGEDLAEHYALYIMDAEVELTNVFGYVFLNNKNRTNSAYQSKSEYIKLLVEEEDFSSILNGKNPLMIPVTN